MHTAHSNTAPPASKEDTRLQALGEYAVFDTPPESDLDRLVELAARMYGTPVAALSLVGRERLYFKSRYGMHATGIGRKGSFCSYAIESDGLFLVPDASMDDRFNAHPLVTEPPQIRFYAGIPLVAPSGPKIGTLCILDTKPWSQFTEEDRRNLEDVADLVMNRLELRRLDQAKAGGHLKFERIASTSPDAILGADASGRINYWNEAATQLFGYTPHEVTGWPIGLIFPERNRDKQSEKVMSVVREGESNPTAQIALTAQRRDGSEFPAELSISTWRENDESGFGAILRDATDRDQGEQRLFDKAHLDSLTGLPNRSFLIGKLAQSVEQETGTLLLLDLDGFKDVNDSLGHAVGDEVLREAAERLRAAAPPETTLARIGADEFAILLPQSLEEADASKQAGNILQLFGTPFAIGGQLVHVGANAGIAIWPMHGTGAGELLANADLALQRSKAALGSSHEFYAPSMRKAVIARRSFEAEMREALAEEQFELFYQPQVRLADRSVIGCEALLRWRHPERGLLSPAEFLPVLENSSLAAPVGDWVLRTACAEAASWRRMGHKDIKLGVNLFSAQFNAGDLPTRVEKALLRNGLPAETLELEVTENIMLRHDENLLVPLREICAWGVGIAFDDYGTGYASLSLLKRFPVTRLKIDKSFVRDLCTDAEDAAIIQAIMYLGRRLGLAITAEGIETEAQEEALRLYGCTEAQGYLYARPLPAGALMDFLRQDPERTVA